MHGTAAASTFRDSGFGGVGIDDIGGELGIAGPALYQYFDTKAEILVAIVSRFHEWLLLEMTRALRTPCPDEDVIAQLVRGYIPDRTRGDRPAGGLAHRTALPTGCRSRAIRPHPGGLHRKVAAVDGNCSP